MNVPDEWLPREGLWPLPYKTRLTDRLVFFFLRRWANGPRIKWPNLAVVGIEVAQGATSVFQAWVSVFEFLDFTGFQAR